MAQNGLTVKCPTCGAPSGMWCWKLRHPHEHTLYPHRARILLAGPDQNRRAPAVMPLTDEPGSPTLVREKEPIVNDHWNTVGGRQDWGRLLASIDEQTSAIKDVVDAVKEQTAAIGQLITALQAHDAAQFGDGQITDEDSEPSDEDPVMTEPTEEEWAEINRRAQWQDPLAADKARGELG